MKVGLDLDGVCYDFDRALAHWLVNFRSWDPASCPPAKTWHFYTEWGMTSQEFAKECNRAVDAGLLLEDGFAYPGLRDSLQRIVNAGHTLHVITARDFGIPGIAEADTRVWTVQNLPPVQSLTFASDKTLVRTDVMIDDKLSNYDALVEAGTKAYLMDRPWNQASDRTRNRVSSLDQFADEILVLDLEPANV